MHVICVTVYWVNICLLCLSSTTLGLTSILPIPYNFKMEQLKDLVKLGQTLGYEGSDLQSFVDQERRKIEQKAQAEADRAERIARREEAREEANRRENEAARQHEAKMLQLKKEMAENANNTTVADVNLNSSKNFSPKIPPFEENRDSIDSYLERFERFAKGQQWETTDWSIRLSSLLKGKALEVYSRLAIADAMDYEKLKIALLRRFQMTEEGYKVKFRTSRPEKSESPSQFAARLEDYLDKWIKMAEVENTYQDLKELILREQILISCCKDLAVFLKERKCNKLETFVEQAERFYDAHGYYTPSHGNHSKTTFSQKQGKQTEKFTPKSDDSKNKYTGNKGLLHKDEKVTCHICKRVGHIARNCYFRKESDFKSKALGQSLQALPKEQIVDQKSFATTVAEAVVHAMSSVKKENKAGNKEQTVNDTGAACIHEKLGDCCKHDGKVKLQCGHELNILSLSCDGERTKENSLQMPVYKGFINGEYVSVLRDSGCSTAVVKTDLVRTDQLTGEQQTCVLIDGTVRQFPLARIYVNSPFFTGEIEALCMPKPVYDIIIGNLKGARDASDPDLNWEQSFRLSQINNEIEIEKGTSVQQAVETRGQKAKRARIPSPLKVVSPLSDINPEAFLKDQKEDPTLRQYWEKAKETQEGRYKFVIKNNYLLRTMTTNSSKNTKPRNRLVVPIKYRGSIMKLGHEGIMSGHLGISRTMEKISSQFYWPNMQKEISDFCHSCDVCQRTLPKGKVTRVPLGKVPIIDEPFKRIAMDLVGPIFPISDRGNRYILTLIDYATRYPEAVALPDIRTETIAEALIEIYSRLGIPEEVLTDMGSQFTSSIMREVSRLLSIKQMTTTPFHPICNGLIENFHSTLKLMLKRLCCERPKDWDRYLSATLFAYREAPQESTKFSPFELMYGRTVRGPMQVLKELFTKEGTDSEVKTTYEYVVDLKERIRDTCELAHQHLEKANERYKHYYDRKSKPRSLEVGDKTLILLPTDRNKLLLQWKGPFPVVARFNENDYQVKVNGKIKSFHINMLKKYISRPKDVQGLLDLRPSDMVIEQLCSVMDTGKSTPDCMQDSEMNDVIPMPYVIPKESNKDVQVNPQLTNSQKDDLGNIISRYSSIFTDVPKKTNVMECEIHLTTSTPIRSKPYPVPQAVRETMRNEIKNMLSLGIIEHSSSSYASPVVMVRKKDGSVRFCVDFRRLNRIITFDPEPMPNPDVLFSELSQDKFFSKIDLTKGYWQIPMAETSKDVTSFVTPEGHYKFLFMPFGLVVAPAVFTRMMRKLFDDVENVTSYIDDILIHTKTWLEHVSTVEKVCQILEKANLAAKPSKCFLGFENLEFLGHHVGNGKLATNPLLIKKIQNSERPETKKQVRSFLGLTGYYRRFIPNYSHIAVPLTDLTRKGQPNKLVWGDAQEKSFQTLKSSLAKPPILQLPDPEKTYYLRTDASDSGLGAILMQRFDGLLHPLAYASRKLNKAEQNYSTIERECLAIIWAVSKFDLYLFGKPFVIQTDHRPLTYMNKTKCINKRVMHWALTLQEYCFTIEAVSGRDNHGPDFLSRVPAVTD